MTSRSETEGQQRTGTNRPDGDGADVQALLDAFAVALTAGDGEAIAELWNLPAYVLGDDMARTVELREEVVEFFGSAKEQYAKMGITDTRAEIARLEWLTERIVVVEVRWPYLDADGDEKGEEWSTYTLRRDDAGKLKICVTLMQGASGADQPTT